MANFEIYEQEFKLLIDIDHRLFIEKDIRVGLSQCSKRVIKANIKYKPNFDPNKTSVSVKYFDINKYVEAPYGKLK